MPKLLVFAACDRIIIDDQGIASLIGVFSKLVAVPRETDSFKDVPKNAAGPKEWGIFTLWQSEPGDHARQFVQVFQIFCPDKTEFVRTKLNFTFRKSLRQHQTRMNVSAFPIGQTGDVEVRTWLEVESQPVTETYSWFVTVEHGTEAKG